jgi:hypothetical protein
LCFQLRIVAMITNLWQNTVWFARNWAEAGAGTLSHGSR